MPTVYTDINDFLPYATSMVKRFIRSGNHDGLQKYINELAALEDGIDALIEETPAAWQKYKAMERERRNRAIQEQQNQIAALDKQLAEAFGGTSDMASDANQGTQDTPSGDFDVSSFLSDNDESDDDSDDDDSMFDFDDDGSDGQGNGRPSDVDDTSDDDSEQTEDDDDHDYYAVFGGDYGDSDGGDDSDSDSWGNMSERDMVDDQAYDRQDLGTDDQDIDYGQPDDDDVEQHDEASQSSSRVQDDRKGRAVTTQGPNQSIDDNGSPDDTADDDDDDDDGLDDLLIDDDLLGL